MEKEKKQKMKCEICGIREAVTSYIEEKNNQKQMVHVCEECFQSQENIEELRCDVCRMSYREFLVSGVFGCENCYRVFKAQTVKLLENQILQGKQKTIQIEKSKTEKGSTKIKKTKKELLKELEEILELAKKEKDIEKIERIEKEIKKLKELEIEKN